MPTKERMLITGGNPLEGEVRVSGGKNTAVAVIPATLLCDEPCTIENLPDIADVYALVDILRALGAKVEYVPNLYMKVDPRTAEGWQVSYADSQRLRASYYLLGALLGRRGEAEVYLPGGCAIGARPIDQHIKGFEMLGAAVDETEDYVALEPGEDGLHGQRIRLDMASVGATVNIMLAACLIPGQTIIETAAKEPHIVDLANFLNTMGARITGAGTDTIKIRGVNELKGGTYAIIPDQIEAGTYMAAVAAAGGNVLVQNVIPKHMDCITSKLQEMGAKIINYDDSIRIIRNGPLRKSTVKTRPYPGFPTDMQAQICVCMALAGGVSRLTESVYETRFFGYCTELKSMGANIKIDGKTATVTGVSGLHGATVCAHDLRAGAALVIAGLAAEGVTYVEHIHFIERGYEHLVRKLTELGADIRRIED